jgi:hypothetical protein
LRRFNELTSCIYLDRLDPTESYAYFVEKLALKFYQNYVTVKYITHDGKYSHKTNKMRETLTDKQYK